MCRESYREVSLETPVRELPILAGYRVTAQLGFPPDRRHLWAVDALAAMFSNCNHAFILLADSVTL